MPAELQYFVKLILILSQGQASVERGFDVNKAVLKVNMNEKSVVSHKLIEDRIQKNSLLSSTIEITNKLIRSAKAASQRNELDHEQEKKGVKQDEYNQQLSIFEE